MNQYKREWSRSDCLKLIQLYEAATSLWDVRDEDYKNKVKKKKAYEVIAKEFSTGTLELKRKIHNLRSQWQAELKKVKASVERGDEERYESPWWCFRALGFLSTVQDGELVDPLEKRADYVAPIKQESEIVLEYIPEELDPQSDQSDYEPESPKPKKKKKKTNEVPPTTFVATGVDDDQIFGDYVASVMRGLSDGKKKKLRRKIQVAIVEVEEDHEVITPTSMKAGASMW